MTYTCTNVATIRRQRIDARHKAGLDCCRQFVRAWELVSPSKCTRDDVVSSNAFLASNHWRYTRAACRYDLEQRPGGADDPSTSTSLEPMLVNFWSRVIHLPPATRRSLLKSLTRARYFRRNPRSIGLRMARVTRCLTQGPYTEFRRQGPVRC